MAPRALKSKSTREVLGKLQYIYLTYGVPRVIQHAQSKEFTSKVDISLYIFITMLSSITVMNKLKLVGNLPNSIQCNEVVSFI